MSVVQSAPSYREEYAAKLTQDQWLARRDQVLERDRYKCRRCNAEESLHVHHIVYRYPREPWDYPLSHLITLCDQCHSDEHSTGKDGWNDLRVVLVNAGCFGEAAGYLADGFDNAKLAGHDWPVLGKVISALLTLHSAGRPLAMMVGEIDKLAIDWDAGRDDAGFEQWLENNQSPRQKIA